MKSTTRLSVAAVAAAALVVPAASIGSVAGAAPAHPGTPASAATSTAASAPAGKIVAHVKGVTSNHRHVTGTFSAQQFSVENGRLMVTGVLSGVMTGKGKATHFRTTRTVPVQTVNGVPAAVPTTTGTAAAARTATDGSTMVNAAACQVLNLNLGPLDLNLLGLQVHLNQVVLNVVAQSGAGNLLGNLLCAVAGLLDNSTGGILSGLLTQLTGLLNQILGALGGAPAAV